MTSVSGVYYSVISEESGTAQIGRKISEEAQNALADTTLEAIDLFSFVTLNSRRYRVTEIAENAFYRT